MRLAKPDAILFDFDDTLVSSKMLITTALENTLIKFDLLNEATAQATRNFSSKSAKDYFPNIFKTNATAAIDFYRAQYRLLSEQQGIQPMAGAITCLNYLTNLPNKPFISLISNKLGEILRREVAQLGWNNYFNSIIGAGDAIADKPSAEPLKLALNNSNGLAPSTATIWFVGDSIVDMQAAYNFGCYSVLINEDYDQNLFMQYSPNIHVIDHRMLLKLFQNYW